MTLLQVPAQTFPKEHGLIGVFGGSGLYQIDGLGTHIETIPAWEIGGGFGKPSSDIQIFEVSGQLVAFIARHGVGHILSPSDIPYRENVLALKLIGAQCAFSLSACGTNNVQQMPSGTFVVLQDLIDMTQRPRTFVGRGFVGHVPMNPPFCEGMRQWLLGGLQAAGIQYYDGGTCVCIEGPQFSTYAWSQLCQRVWGTDIMNMTPGTEAALCREAKIPYAVVGLVTDEDNQNFGQGVHTDVVERTFSENMVKVESLLPILFRQDSKPQCQCAVCENSLAHSLHTRPNHISSLGRELKELFS